MPIKVVKGKKFLYRLDGKSFILDTVVQVIMGCQIKFCDFPLYLRNQNRLVLLICKKQKMRQILLVIRYNIGPQVSLCNYETGPLIIDTKRGHKQ